MVVSTFIPVYALCIAVILTVGETLVLVKTDKYWPLSADDYVVCAVLAYTASTFETLLSQLLMLLAWAFMAGNLYAMLFTRMDPVTGTRDRLAALSVLLAASVGGAILTLLFLINSRG